MKARVKTVESLTCLILILASSLIALSFLPIAVAETSILGVNPNTGNVGTLVTVTANVTTANGNYGVYFDQDLTASGAASANSVTATFVVPESIVGNHVVTVVDVATNDNATANFTVTTSYSLVIPEFAKPLQENDSVPISVNITGGESGKIYAANVTVRAPSNASYVKALSVRTSALGSGSATANYPGDFSAGAKTSLVGNYTALLNTTLGFGFFAVGLTNSTEYHRNQTVNVKALYEPNENVTLTIAGNGISDSVNLTDPSGLIRYNWTVPMTAPIGNYTVRVSSLSGATIKNPPDVQNFTVPGFVVNVTAKNLAEEPVPNVILLAYENGTVVDNKTTSAAGIAGLSLEVGTYTCNATTQNEVVGERVIEVNDTASLDLVCNLTNLRVQVVAGNLSIPGAGVYLTQAGQTLGTDINGTAVFHSLLPDLTYDFNVTRYSALFNVTQLSQLSVNGSAVAWYNVTVSLPTMSLQVTVSKSGGQPFNNTLLRVQELSGQPVYEQYTDENGSALFSPPFGTYNIRVYGPTGIVLNETTVTLFQNRSTSLACDLYGLTLSIRVVDYFGQGIGNVNVRLQREGVPATSARTQGDGTATFDNVIGGDMEVVLFMGDSTQPVVSQGLTVESSTTIQLQLDKYIVLAGLLVDTEDFAVIIVIVLAVVLVLVLEVYRSRRLKSKKGETESSDTDS